VSGSSDNTRSDWIDGGWQVADERPLIDDVGLGEPETNDLLETVGMYLRAERERRLIGLDQVEAATCIRTAQLRAIEEDRLDDLPAETYARGFVRTYAEQLGLEPEDVVDRFNRQWSDTHPRADADAPAPFERRMVPVDVSRRPPGRAALAAAVALLLVSLAVVIVRSQSGGSAGAASRHAQPATTAPPPSSSSPPPTSNAPPPAPAGVRLALLATPGACWFEARRGSPTGPLLAERTLAAGQVAHLHGRRVWLRVGNATSARLRVNGRTVPLAAVAGPVNLLVSAGKVTRL